MAVTNGTKRKRDHGPPRSKKQKKIDAYHSSSSESEDDEQAGGIDLPNVVKHGESHMPAKPKAVTFAEAELDEQDDSSENDVEEDDEPDLRSGTEDEDDDDSNLDEPREKNANKKRKNKRDDPTALATSISKILSSKLTTTNRADPVLSRSATAAEAASSVQDSKLERAAKRKMREEKHAKRERGRVKDVMALSGADAEMARVIEEERRLRKLAQRGVVRLFNAVRAAQVQGESEGVKSKRSGEGRDKQKERVTEMSKKGFLDLLNAGTA